MSFEVLINTNDEVAEVESFLTPSVTCPWQLSITSILLFFSFKRSPGWCSHTTFYSVCHKCITHPSFFLTSNIYTRQWFSPFRMFFFLICWIAKVFPHLQTLSTCLNIAVSHNCKSMNIFIPKYINCRICWRAEVSWGLISISNI